MTPDATQPEPIPAEASGAAVRPSDLECRLLDAFQRGFPLTPCPYAELGRRLGCDEATVIAALDRLARAGVISRVGAVLAPHRLGRSTLAAMAVPAERLEAVARIVSAFPEVNHNYEREHRFNLWFVVTGRDAAHVAAVLQEIEAVSGLPILDLPLIEPYRLDLGFPLQWT